MQRIGSNQLRLYHRRRALSQKISDLERRLGGLKDERREIDSELLDGALEKGGDRLLPSGRTLSVTRVDVPPQIVRPEDVGTQTRAGYTFYRFTEKAPS